MKITTRTVTVPRPRDAVFRWLTDPANAPRWLSLVDALVPEGPLAVGTRMRVEATIGGERRTQHTTITAWDPPARYANETVEGGVVARFSYVLDAVGDAETRVSFTLDVSPRTLTTVVRFPIVALAARNRLADRLERLAAGIAAAAPGGSG